MKEKALQALWSTWELTPEIKPKRWNKKERETRRTCAQRIGRYYQADKLVKKGPHEDKYSHKVLRMGLVPRRVWRSKAASVVRSQKSCFTKGIGKCSRKQALSIALAVPGNQPGD